MNHHKFALFALTVLLGGGTAYAANEQTGSKESGIEEAREQIKEDYSWKKLDADQDGYVSYTEAETNQLMTGLWDKFDTDRDQQWSEAEYQVFQNWSNLDADNSGDLSQEEAQSNAVLSEQWETLDANDDDTLTTEEFAEFNEEGNLLEDESEASQTETAN